MLIQTPQIQTLGAQQIESDKAIADAVEFEQAVSLGKGRRALLRTPTHSYMHLPPHAPETETQVHDNPAPPLLPSAHTLVVCPDLKEDRDTVTITIII